MKKFLKNYGFIVFMLAGIVIGCVTGLLWPAVKDGEEYIDQGARVLEPLGTIFINLMFCMVVPMVFSSMAGAIANMGSAKRAGRIMGTAVAVFLITGLIAAAIMAAAVQIVPPVPQPWQTLEATVCCYQISWALTSIVFAIYYWKFAPIQSQLRDITKEEEKLA